jgi:uncharacterized membrane protein YcaP (DUF421 family)
MKRYECPECGAEYAVKRTNPSAELTEALRHQGRRNITQVRAAILEDDGKITVITS